MANVTVIEVLSDPDIDIAGGQKVKPIKMLNTPTHLQRPQQSRRLRDPSDKSHRLSVWRWISVSELEL